jgi:hypothetical protein
LVVVWLVDCGIGFASLDLRPGQWNRFRVLPLGGALSEAAGLRFVRFARGGWRIYFSDQQYQREFDQDNGLAFPDMPDELTVRERLAMLGLGVGLLSLDALFAGMVLALGSPGELYSAALLAVAITGLAAGVAGIIGKGKSVSKWLLRPTSYAEFQKYHEQVVQQFEQAGFKLSPVDKQIQKPLSLAVGWGIFLGFLAVALALVVWTALRN